MKIGIYDGAFNPPHVGHFIVVEHVREERIELTGSEALMKHLSQEARRWAEQFRWKSVVLKTVEIYRLLIQQNVDPR